MNKPPTLPRPLGGQYPQNTIGLTIILSGGLVVSVLASPRSNLVWGINMWGLWPVPVRVVVLLLGLMLIWLPLRRNDKDITVHRGESVWALASVAVLFSTVWILFTARTLLFGDGIEIASRFASGLVITPRSPVFSAGVPLLIGGQAPAKIDPNHIHRTIQFISISSGLLYLLLLSRFWYTRSWRCGLCAVGAFTGAYLCLFQGHVEAYPLFVVVEAAWLLTVLEQTSNRRHIMLGLIQILLVSTHILGWLFLPVTLWLLTGTVPGRGRRAILIGAVALVCGSILLMIRDHLPTPLRFLDPVVAMAFVKGKAWALLHPSAWTSGAGFLNWTRLIDVLNGMVLTVGPALLVAAGLATFRDGRRALASAIATPIGAVAGIMLFARFVVDSGLGPFLDWDLYACFFVPVLFVVGLALADQSMRGFCRTAAVPVTATAMLLTLPAALMLGLPEKATQRVQLCVDGVPPPAPMHRAHLEHRLGDQLAVRGDLSGAAEAFSRAFRYDPSGVYARRLGVTLRDIGRKEEAIDAFSLALSVDGLDVVSLEQRGMLLLQTNRLQEAARDFRAAVQLDPGRCATRLNLGMIEEKVGAADKSREDLEAAVECFHQNLIGGRGGPNDQALIAEALMSLGRYSEAADEWRLVVATDPQRPRPLYNLAESCLRTSRPAEAIEVLEKLLPRFPRSTRLRARLGDAYAASGRFSEAVGLYEACLRIKDNREVRHRIALARGVLSGSAERKPVASQSTLDSLLNRVLIDAWLTPTGDLPGMSQDPQ